MSVHKNRAAKYFIAAMKHAARCALGISFFFLIALFPRCSTYFNMFYNAENAFDEGYALHKKVLHNFPDSIMVEPPSDARAKYDRAIEKAAKVLEVYPKSKKWHDDAYFLMGKSFFYEKETGKALRWFRQLRDEYPQSPLVPESYVYASEAYILEGNLDKAEEMLTFALSRYPYLDKDQNLSLLLVETAVRREGKAQAVERLEQTRRSVRSPEKRFELLVRAAELYIDQRQYGRAITLLHSAPRSTKKPAQEYRVDRDLVSCCMATDSLEAALRLCAEMKANRKYAPYGKEILFTKAAILSRLGRIDEAIEAFQQVTGGKAIDTAAAKNDTSSLSGRAWFELGLLYQKRKGDYGLAQKYYGLAAGRQGHDTVTAPGASRRFQALKSLEAHRAALAGRDTVMGRHQRLFAMGELFSFELDEPDSACRQFMLLADDTAADSVYTPKALCAAAHIMRSDRGDTVRSDSLYSRVIARFPGSDYVATARREMGAAAPAVTTRREQAAAAFRDAEKLYLAGGDAKAAVQAYYNVYREYMDFDIGQKSLFAAAWITDNELQKKKVARSLYEKICERYPKSVYCANEAKPRLKTVTDTLEALRRARNRTGGAAAPGRTATQDSGTIVDSLQAARTKSDTAAALSQDTVLPPQAPPVDSSRGYNPQMGPHGRGMMTEPPSRRTYPVQPPDSLHR